MSELVLDNVSKCYSIDGKRSILALDSLNLNIREGEFFVVLGPSGSGKSTLLRLIAGLETLSSGSIFFSGERLDLLPPKSRQTSMVFQSPALYPQMSVQENLAFALKLRRVSPEKSRERVESSAKLLGIEHLLGRHPETLSGGEQQRVALGRALVTQPRIFLLDEPFSNLDGPARATLRRELQAIQKRQPTTIIYVTHDQVEALVLGDRIAIVNQGRLQQVGTAEEIYQEPQNTFVARFVGSPPMNLVEANLTSGTDGYGLYFGENQQAIAAIDESSIPPRFRTSAPTKAVAGIRAEDLQIQIDGTGVPGVMTWLERTPWGETLMGWRAFDCEWTVRALHPVSSEPGEAGFIQFPTNKWRLFDATTGERHRS
jgi:multiple sugar transport system ATP-binding protein